VDTAPLFRFTPAELTLRDGTAIHIRSITPEDESRMIEFHQALSDDSVHFRYFGMLSLGFRTEHKRLAAICSTDPACEIALVAEHQKDNGEREILGVGRLMNTPGLDEAEFAMLVADQWQGRGLGKALLKALIAVGRNAKVRIFCHVLPGNAAMLNICRQFDFELLLDPDAGEWLGELDLSRNRQRITGRGGP
jgi:acetyltransferase